MMFSSRVSVGPLQGTAIGPAERQMRCFQQIFGCRIRGNERLKEINARSVDTATKFRLQCKAKADMAAGPILWDPKTYPS
jgi:hypothetical protein